MNIYYKFRKKMMRVTRCTRKERMKMVQLPFQKVIELPSLITDQRETVRFSERIGAFLTLEL